MPRSGKDGKYYGVYKSKESWAQAVGEQDGFWVSDNVVCPECFVGELIRDHLVDMEFINLKKAGAKQLEKMMVSGHQMLDFARNVLRVN